MPWQFIILGTCLELLGWSRAMNVFAELPWCPYDHPYGYDGDYQGCTTSMLGDGYQLPSDPEKCWLPAPVTDPYYDFLWCRSVSVDGVVVTTPCTGDFTALRVQDVLGVA